jgi:uncharacterized lipoprotein YddW (UPF0748 family)
MPDGISRRIFTAATAGALSGAFLTTASATAATETGAGHAEDHGHRPELRGMWVATVANIDFPSRPGLPAAEQQRELLSLLDTAVERRLNTVILQVRPTADALWPSPFEPWSDVLTGEQGKDPGWDPLGFAVEQAHRRGLALHAWFNPYRIANHDDLSRLVPTHPARVHPDWVVPYGGKLYYNPGLPEVRHFVEDAIFDAVENYDIDAVHWDDYFYPYPVAGEHFDDDEAFARYGGGFASRADWRRDNVNLLVRETHERLHRTKPQVPFGISPFAIWRNASTDPAGSDTQGGVETYDDLYADTRRWVRERWIDHVVPQVYWNIGFTVADYAKLVPWWADVVRGTGVELYIGEALYKVAAPNQGPPWQDPAELSKHLTFCADYPQVRGNVFFSANQVVADPLGAMTIVAQDHYRHRVRPPR